MTQANDYRSPEGEVIPCRVVSLPAAGAGAGEDAVVSMIAGGHEVPRVSFPMGPLVRHGLTIGARFDWIVRDPESIGPDDVVPRRGCGGADGDSLTPDELANLELLYDEHRRCLADDGPHWPEYTGDGD